MQAETITTPPAVKRGIPSLGCLRCGETGYLYLDLECLETIKCTSCDGEFGTDELRVQVAAGQQLLAWIELAPTTEG